MRKRPPFRRRKLAKKLRKMRMDARMSIDEASARLDKDRNALYRIEAAETRIDVHLGRSMMDVYDCFDAELLDEIRDALKPGWWTTFGVQDRGYIDLETEASIVCELALVQIPGLLQTEAYMRAMFESYRRQRNDVAIDNDVAVRLIRQQRLTDPDNPLVLEAVIDIGALRRTVGSLEIMRAQLEHLLLMAELPNVTLRVLTSGAHEGMSGAFTLLSFPDPDDPDLLFVPYVTGAVHIENNEELKEARLTFDHLAAEALTPDESVALIERILAE